MKFSSDAVLASSQRLYSLTALRVRLSPPVLSLVWEAAAAPSEIRSSQWLRSRPAVWFCFWWHPQMLQSLVPHCILLDALVPPARPLQPWKWPARPRGRSRAWAGPVLWDSLPARLTAWAEPPSPPAALRGSGFPRSLSRGCLQASLLQYCWSTPVLGGLWSSRWCLRKALLPARAACLSEALCRWNEGFRRGLLTSSKEKRGTVNHSGPNAYLLQLEQN